MRAALDTGKMRVISFFPDVPLRFVDEPEIERFDPEHLTFFNVNTPDHLEWTEALAKRTGEEKGHGEPLARRAGWRWFLLSRSTALCC